jgi:hypothetical protein
MNFGAIIFIVVGAVSLGGALYDWDWFMEHRKARLFVRLLGRNGARIFCGLLGAALATSGFLALTGVMRLN